jgi:hypothetical protein
MRLRFIATFALLLATAVTARAQMVALPGSSTETNQPPIIPFLEGTDVFWTVQRSTDGEPAFPNLLEADLFPHLVASQNFSSTLDVLEQSSRGRSRFKEFSYSISGTPAVRIRMLRDISAPVRTPSYMPRVNAQLLWTRGLKDCDPSRSKTDCRPRDAATVQGVEPVPAAVADEARTLLAVPRVSVWEAHVIIGHHSNGQDGCLLNTQSRDPSTDECVPQGTPTAETINRRDGSFSTNYVRTGINYSRNWMEANLEATREARLRVEVEYHPRAWIDDEIEEVYGRTRLIGGAAYATRHVRFCQRRFEGSASLTWNPGVVETVTDLTTSVQASCFPFRNGGWGFFARYYRGQDYYNLGFLEEISRLHIGATFNQSGFFRFRRPTPPSESR